MLCGRPCGDSARFPAHPLRSGERTPGSTTRSNCGNPSRHAGPSPPPQGGWFDDLSPLRWTQRSQGNVSPLEPTSQASQQHGRHPSQAQAHPPTLKLPRGTCGDSGFEPPSIPRPDRPSPTPPSWLPQASLRAQDRSRGAPTANKPQAPAPALRHCKTGESTRGYAAFLQNAPVVRLSILEPSCASTKRQRDRAGASIGTSTS